MSWPEWLSEHFNGSQSLASKWMRLAVHFSEDPTIFEDCSGWEAADLKVAGLPKPEVGTYLPSLTEPTAAKLKPPRVTKAAENDMGVGFSLDARPPTARSSTCWATEQAVGSHRLCSWDTSNTTPPARLVQATLSESLGSTVRRFWDRLFHRTTSGKTQSLPGWHERPLSRPSTRRQYLEAIP